MRKISITRKFILPVFTLIILSVLVISCSNSRLTEYNNGSSKYIVGYLFPGDSLLDGSKIAAEKLTHIIYAFANIENGEIKQGFKNDAENFKILNQAKERNPNLKILISIGGWTWSGRFSDMCLTEESRTKFINSAILFVQKNDLDGIDIDWEFPNQIGDNNPYRPEDVHNFTLLMQELREALDKAGTSSNKHYLLTAATGAFDDYLANTEMAVVQKYLDFVNLMTYDFCEPDADSIAGHNAPLFTNPRDPHHSSDDPIVQEYISDGVPPQKIVLGVPFYGHVWQVHTDEHNGLYEPGGQTKEHIRGSFKNLDQNYVNKNGFVRYWDSTSCVPYLFNEEKKILITYDDPESLWDKCEFINARGLKGAMFWEYNSDYKNMLLQALYNGLNEKQLADHP
jgi:chitinase